MVRVSTRFVGRIGSGVRIGARFKKNARLVSRLGSGLRLVGRRVRFYISSCAVVHAVVRRAVRFYGHQNNNPCAGTGSTMVA